MDFARSPPQLNAETTVDEILVNIFAHCNPPRFKNYRHGRLLGVAADLVALAGTCHMFKEPALDILWSELSDLCPLARCLSHLSYQIIPGLKWYSFRKPLEQAEWDTLRSYTRRVRSVLDFGSAFHPDCVRTFLTPSTPEPLFPNLRYLRCVFANETTPLLYQPLPSLISLDYSFAFERSLPLLQESLQSFPGFSTNMRRLSICVHQPEVMYDKFVSDYICRWSNPHTVNCPQIALDVDALTHLSHLRSLTQLSFALGADADFTIAVDTILFSALHELKLFSGSLDPISRLLHHAQMPAVTDFTVEIGSCPSKHSLASFLTALRPSGISDSVTKLKLTQVHHSLSIPPSDQPVLTGNDLWPSTTLRHIRCLDVNLGWTVSLADSDLLELASAWPHLEHLLINEEWGWQSPRGITPYGLARLLQTCPSLCRLSLAVDTHGCVDIPPLRSPAGVGLDRSPSLSINVVDSVIASASVPAVAAFFADIVPSGGYALSAWTSWAFTWRKNKKVYADRWREVYARVAEVVAQRPVVHLKGSG